MSQGIINKNAVNIILENSDVNFKDSRTAASIKLTYAITIKNINNLV